MVLVMHETGEASMRRAIDRIAGQDSVLERPALIRIEPG